MLKVYFVQKPKFLVNNEIHELKILHCMNHNISKHFTSYIHPVPKITA